MTTAFVQSITRTSTVAALEADTFLAHSTPVDRLIATNDVFVTVIPDERESVDDSFRYAVATYDAILRRLAD